jgi:inhibitor of the pro-sigma K processing machinery
MNTSVIVALVLCGVLFLIISVLFFKQLKGFFSLILNTALGWAGLYIFNLIFPAFTIGINIASASVAGVLGLPGLILLITLKLIYK